MKKRSQYDKALNMVVKPYGFFKCRRTFLRLCGDGVIQSAVYSYEPHSGSGDGYCLYFNTGSIYEHLLFGFTGDVAEMTDGTYAAEYFARKHDMSRSAAWSWDEIKQLSVFSREILPALENVTSQEEVFRFHQEIMLLEHGEIPKHLTKDLYLMLHLGMYDGAYRTTLAYIDYCRDTCSRNCRSFRQNYSPEAIRAYRLRSESELKPYLRIRACLEKEDHTGIYCILEDQRDRNLNTLASMLPKSRQGKLAAFRNGIADDGLNGQ